MQVGVYDSGQNGTILFYIHLPKANVDKTRLVAVDIKLKFIPIYGMRIKAIYTGNRGVAIDKNKSTVELLELYEGTNIYVVIDMSKTDQYESTMMIDEALMAINTTYYDVNTCKHVDVVNNSYMSIETNKVFDDIVRDIKSNNRPKIKPCSNITMSVEENDMDLFNM
jgi:hypothetical protein